MSTELSLFNFASFIPSQEQADFSEDADVTGVSEDTDATESYDIDDAEDEDDFESVRSLQISFPALCYCVLPFNANQSVNTLRIMTFFNCSYSGPPKITTRALTTGKST